MSGFSNYKNSLLKSRNRQQTADSRHIDRFKNKHLKTEDPLKFIIIKIKKKRFILITDT